jgi:NADH-quinone oxidoreductase subunit J
MDLLLFGIPALVAIVGAIAMLLSRNAVHSALYLLLNFTAISVLYLLLQAPFLFATQLIVYAGAIIVLFLFVVMLLGAERDEQAPHSNPWQNRGAFLGGVVLLVELVMLYVRNPGTIPVAADLDNGFAAPAEIAKALFTTHLLPFEIASFVLLTALIGVVVLHQRRS